MANTTEQIKKLITENKGTAVTLGMAAAGAAIYGVWKGGKKAVRVIKNGLAIENGKAQLVPTQDLNALKQAEVDNQQLLAATAQLQQEQQVIQQAVAQTTQPEPTKEKTK